MKKNYFKTLLVLLALTSVNLKTVAQCTNVTPYTTVNAPAIGGTVLAASCAYAGEYATINAVAAGSTFSVSSTILTDYITVRSGTSNGPLVASGNTPLVWTAALAGSYFIHVNTNSACGTQNTCRDIRLGRFGPACTNAFQYGTVLAPNPTNTVTVFCNYAEEYATINGAVAGNVYVSYSTVNTDYYTIRSGTPNGPVVATGLTPLTWTAQVAGVHYAHITTNSLCATDQNCRDNALTCIGGSIPAPPANDLCANGTSLAIPGTYTGTSINATLENPLPPMCITSAPTQPGVWYTITGNGNKLGLNTGCASGWDSKLWVFTGACGSWTCVTGNDDNGPICASAAASVTWCSQPGVIYRVLVAGFSSASAFTLNLTQTVVATPVITATQFTICSGNTATLSVAGSASNVWNPGALSGNSQTFSPLATTVYTVNGLDNGTGCASSATATLTVNASPTITVNSGSICAGDSFTITPGGASTYTVSGGNLVVSPASNSTYTITGTNAQGCEGNQAISDVTVVPLPNIVITGDSVLCEGETTVLLASGGTSYIWSTTALTNTVSVTPATTTSYTVMGLANSCSNIAVNTVTVNPNPTVTVTGNNVICEGQTVNLTATGASSYSWSTGSSNATITETPMSNVSYTVTGTTGDCTDDAVISVTVNALPTVSLSASNTITCLGDTTINLTGTPIGGIYSGTGVTGGIFSPSSIGTFTTVYTYTDVSTGCANATSLLIEVSECVGLTVQNKSLKGIQVYPNPNHGEFTIELINGSAKNIEVTDVTGRVVFTTNTLLDNINLSIAELANGVYYLRISSENLSEVIKLVKQ